MLTMDMLILKSKNGDNISKGNYRLHCHRPIYVKNLDICMSRSLVDYIWTTDKQFANKNGHSTDMCVLCSKKRFDLIGSAEPMTCVIS